MVDIQELANAGALSAVNFEFRVGNSNTPGSWTTGPTPSSVTVRAGAGVGGSDRVTLIWPDGAIAKQWLQVIIKADDVTGLVAPDVFYFGNAAGESGNSASNTFADGTDFAGARDNPHNILNRATLTEAYDYNRDSFVDGSDLAIARDNGTNFLTALKLLTVPTSAPAPVQILPTGGEREAVPALFQPIVPPRASSLGNPQASCGMGTTAIVSASPPRWPSAKPVARDMSPYAVKRNVPRLPASSSRADLLTVVQDWDVESALDTVAADVAGVWSAAG